MAWRMRAGCLTSLIEGLNMSHTRLARIGLIVAALGLNAAPAMLGMSAAQAAEKEKAPAEAPKDAIRPEMYKLLDPAQTKDLIAAKNFAEFQSRIDASAAMPNLTPYETFVLNQMRVQLGQASENYPLTVQGLEAMIDSGRLKQEDKLRFIDAVAGIYYSNLKDYDKAIVWFNRYGTESGDQAKQRQYIVRSYFLKNDFATAKTEALKDIDAAKKSGVAPPKDELNLLGNVGIKTKDTDLYLQAVEELTRYYPSEDYWFDLLNRTRGKKTYAPRLDLDIARLKAVATPSKMEPEDYAEQAELAVLGGFFTEAKIAMDKGFPGGIPAGKDKAALQKIRDSANKGAADDAKNIDAGIAAAQKSKDGVGLVNLGYNFITLGQFDKGIDLMKQGVAKGVAKNPDDAKLRLGYALAMAGKKDESVKILETITGNDGRGDLARYWIMYQNKPATVAAK
jgi:tetratricopeptide (TPR) repeat protein